MDYDFKKMKNVWVSTCEFLPFAPPSKLALFFPALEKQWFYATKVLKFDVTNFLIRKLQNHRDSRKLTPNTTIANNIVMFHLETVSHDVFLTRMFTVNRPDFVLRELQKWFL